MKLKCFRSRQGLVKAIDVSLIKLKVTVANEMFLTRIEEHRYTKTTPFKLNPIISLYNQPGSRKEMQCSFDISQVLFCY